MKNVTCYPSETIWNIVLFYRGGFQDSILNSMVRVAENCGQTHSCSMDVNAAALGVPMGCCYMVNRCHHGWHSVEFNISDRARFQLALKLLSNASLIDN